MFRNIESKMDFLAVVYFFISIVLWMVGIYFGLKSLMDYLVGEYEYVKALVVPIPSIVAAVFGFLLAWVSCLPVLAIGERVDSARRALHEAQAAKEAALEFDGCLCACISDIRGKKGL